ncbi:Hypothetical protein CM240_3066 [Clostridium bornimense]|uniref:Opine dehydrogenase n=1 Tax=Clostridium bornimense TaxID=1216932 RepID=W6S0B6_9CLOT|nr:NAD/NADP octopine/nopaline dehydrogenase family protein [Clostridium bornimense]CDM70183.1 Hypothetical protein CM240_3066 [Clostridium bornimense]
MNIGVIGAGNIGTYLATYISRKENCKVWLHTSKVDAFKEEIILIEEEKCIEHAVKIHCISESMKEVVEDADLVLITHPSFMMEKTLKEVSKNVKKGAIVGSIPGFGGKEYYIDELIEKECTFFGSQRVPSITRLEIYGEVVSLKQKNEFMKISSIPHDKCDSICNLLTGLIDIPCIPIESYLAITLSPSNPTMHPSRLYELFEDHKEGKIYENHSLFYEEWNDLASSTLLQLDEELKEIFKSLNEFNDFNAKDFERIKSRYNIETPSELTNKIRTAPGFQGIRTPMVESQNGFIPDLNSRYFIEDIEFGLCIIKAFAELCRVKTPTVDKLILWAQELLGKEYLLDGKLIGKDAKHLIIPQSKGINTKQDLINYYKTI